MFSVRLIKLRSATESFIKNALHHYQIYYIDREISIPPSTLNIHSWSYRAVYAKSVREIDPNIINILIFQK